MRPADKEYQEKMLKEQEEKLIKCLGNFCGIMSGHLDKDKARDCIINNCSLGAVCLAITQSIVLIQKATPPKDDYGLGGQDGY